MIWIAWRYQRSVVLALGLLALVVIGFSIFNGVLLHHDWMQFLGAPCHGSESATNAPGDVCGVLDVKLANAEHYSSEIRFAGFIIAPLVGAILGLLAVGNELDNRTARLAWTQSISRTRWFVAKAASGPPSSRQSSFRWRLRCRGGVAKALPGMSSIPRISASPVGTSLPTDSSCSP